MKKMIGPLLLIFAVTFGQIAAAQETFNEELLKAQGLVKQGEGEEASIILEKLMQNHPDNKEAVRLWLIANMQKSPSRPVSADKQLDSLGLLFPNNTAILLLKSLILPNFGRSEEALSICNTLITSQPDNAENWTSKGSVLISLERHQEALLAYDKATLLDPNINTARVLKTHALIRMKNYDKALVAINELIEFDPDNLFNYYNRARIYCQKGDKTNTLTDLEKALKMSSRLKGKAKTDEDFKSLWEDEDFKRLIE